MNKFSKLLTVLVLHIVFFILYYRRLSVIISDNGYVTAYVYLFIHSFLFMC